MNRILVSCGKIPSGPTYTKWVPEGDMGVKKRKVFEEAVAGNFPI